MKRHIAVLGTGRMGSTLALAFLGHGHTVTVWNRTTARAKPLEAKGARVATSLEGAIAEAEILVGNVSDYSATAALLAPIADSKVLREKLFVQLATGTPRQAREAAEWAAARQLRYLDGAIMATPSFIGQPGCTILYSGSKQLFDANASVFAALGGNAVYAGADIAHANTLDAAILIVLWGSLFGAWQAAAICEAEGFPLDVFAKTLSATVPVLDDSLRDTITRIAERRFAADATTSASVEICHASVRLIHEISEERGIHRGLTTALTALFDRAKASGRGADDLSAVYLGMR